MSEVPSLITLCIGVIKDEILDENGNLPYVYKLPSELFDRILPHLPPLALQNLQDAMPFVSCNDFGFSDGCLKPPRKRKRFENFDAAWKSLYVSRWSVQKLSVELASDDVEQNKSTTNWQQIYWEKHLQNCLDAAAEIVSIPSFDGCLGEVQIPDALLKFISYEGHPSRSRYSKLAYNCERFGPYARCLRLQNVHCGAEIGHLLRKSRLEYLEMHWIKSKEQVEGLCKLLERNKESLASLEFIHCKLPASLVSAICEAIHAKGFETDVIKSFSIKRSSFLDSSFFPLPLGLESLLSAARGLTTLILSDNHLWWRTAKMLFDTLLDTESGLQVLDLSDNNIAGWLSHFKWGSQSCVKSDRQINKSLKALRVLNLRTLFPYLIEKSKRDVPIAELFFENCELSCHGASQLLKAIYSFKVPLKSLSIGDNHLGSEFGASMGKFLQTGIQTLDVKRIGLASSGFSEAQKEIVEELNSLAHVNISCNCGGAGAANFLSKMISRAPKLVSVDASYNWIPMESLPLIYSCLKAGRGKLEHLDLTRNQLCNKPNIVSLLAEFQINGKPKILLSPPFATDALYDNDP